MNGKFYLICDHESSEAFFVSDAYSVPRAFVTEEAATAAAKEYPCETLVLKAVALVTEVTEYKVEGLK